MPLNSSISYKVTGDYYTKPKTTPKPAPKPALPPGTKGVGYYPPNTNNQYTRGQTPVPGMAGYKIPQRNTSKKSYDVFGAVGSLFRNSNPYISGQKAIPGMAGWSIPQREQGVGFKPSKAQQIETMLDTLFGANPVPATVNSGNPYINGQRPIPGMAGWSTPPQNKGVGYQPTHWQRARMELNDQFGFNDAPQPTAPTRKEAIPWSQSGYAGSNSYGSGYTPSLVPEPYHNYYDVYNNRSLDNRLMRKGPFANEYEEGLARQQFMDISSYDQTVIPMGLRPWISTLRPDYKDPWASDPYDPGGDPYMHSTLENNTPTGGGGGGSGGGWGGWGGYSGGGGGGYGASSGVNSYLPGARAGYGARVAAPNYLGRGAGRGASYAGGVTENQAQWRMPMLVWNI